MPHKDLKERQKYEKEYYRKNKDIIAKITHEHYIKNKDKIREKNWIRNRKLKVEVMTFYSYDLGKPMCKDCSEDDIMVLTIDHINGGGTQQRKSQGGGGSGFYRWLKRNGYPKGYETVCMNCNFRRHIQKTSLY